MSSSTGRRLRHELCRSFQKISALLPGNSNFHYRSDLRWSDISLEEVMTYHV